MNKVKYRQPHELDASIRMISHYDCGSDSTQTRLDVLMGDEKLPCNQYPFGLSSSPPGHSPLHIPNGRGIIGGFDVRVSSEDLVLALRSLANAIEAHKAAPSFGISIREITEYRPSLDVVVQRHPEHLSAVTPVQLEEAKPSTNDRLWRALRAAAGG